ncbi:helix-turn-helix domain-containing protein, partial [Kibdelosporangium lantanae]
MSIEAISWVLNHASIPSHRRDASSLAMVLVGLANHADPDGCNAFPSVATLVRYTRLSERSVQNALRALEELGLILPSDPQIVAAYVKRADRRPNGWDLVIHNPIHSSVHNPVGGVQTLHPVGTHGVQTCRHGVQTTTPRGADSAPEPSLNHPRNRPTRERATNPP